MSKDGTFSPFNGEKTDDVMGRRPMTAMASMNRRCCSLLARRRTRQGDEGQR
jgi:hypothetical protein